MSRKRKSEECNNDEQTNEAFNCKSTQTSFNFGLFEPAAKRAKRSPLSDAAMKMTCKKVAQIVWKDKEEDLEISTPEAGGWQWSDILPNIFLQTPKKFRMEVLHEAEIEKSIFRVATMKDELFVLCRPEKKDPFINVHDRNNMDEVKDVIPLPGILPVAILASSVSNCVYLLEKRSLCYSVLRIRKGEEHQFGITTWIGDLSLSFPGLELFGSANGNLIILSKKKRPSASVVSIYNANGAVEHAIRLSPVVHRFSIIFSVIQKSSGNLIIATICNQRETYLKEIDMVGRILRQYHSSTIGDIGVMVADDQDRIMITGLGNGVELLDSEFNRLDLSVPKLKDNIFRVPCGMHYNSERNEIVRLYDSLGGPQQSTRILLIFRITQE